MKSIVPSSAPGEVLALRSGKRLAGRGTRLAAAVAAGVVMVGLAQAPAGAEPRPAPFTPPKQRSTPSVPVTEVKPVGFKRADMPDATRKPKPVWPAAGTAVADVPPAPAGADRARSVGGRTRAGTLPVYVARPGAAKAQSAGARAGAQRPAPQRVQVRVLDRTATDKAGVRGLLLRVGRGDGKPDAAVVDVTVDYRQFSTAYGADWASRLRLMTLPECALTTPGKRQCAGIPLPSRNDPSAGTVNAQVPLAAASPITGAQTTEVADALDAGSTLLAVAAAESGPAGDYKATSLQPSSTWSAGGNSGDFTWSYPMRVPPAAGGPAPEVGLSYSAQSVDGRHAASNNQPSWVGEGFETTSGGFIERAYEGCADDMTEDGEPGANNTEETGDLCWATDNAVLSLSGHSGELIYNSSEGRWHVRGDDGSRVQRLTGAANGDNNGEYWVVTTTDGVQYWFGAHNKLPGWTDGKPVTNSTWTAPVFGNHAGEPCHATAFADSSCQQAWRWNLDYVVDLHGNSASYWYVSEPNRYARNKDSDDLVAYDRGGYLDYIAYATRRDGGADSIFSTSAPARVDFAVDDRCLSGCDTHDDEGVHWPDTPWDQECKADDTDCTTFSPTFWSTKRLASVTTQVRNGSAYDNVERWTLTHTFPDPGDGTRAGLWLSKISHTGLVGTDAGVPDIEFTGVQLSNRVDTIDFAAAMNWWRISQIRTETGGTITVNYSDQECVARTKVPTAPASNTLRCYPVRWTPEGYDDPVTDYFHKYLVTRVYEADNTGGVVPKGSPPKVTRYSYLTDPAWHYADDDGLIEKKDKTWSMWRGYGKVGVTVGEPGEQTYNETTYFRGMHGDKSATGTRTVPVEGTGVPTVNDEDAYAGMMRETVVRNGPTGAEISRQVFEPWQSAPTASRTINGDTVQARFTGTVATHNRTVLDGGRPVRITSQRKTFDAYGMTIAVDDTGDAAVTGDEKCTKNTYEPRNTSAWLLTAGHRTQVFAKPCAGAADPSTLTDDDIVSDNRISFDGQAYGSTPTRGLATKTETARTWNAGNPAYDVTGRAAHDAHGRITSSWDALDKLTTTAYTPTTGGLVTQAVVTNPLSHVTTTTFDPSWGTATSIVDPNGKQTDLAYDGLGRLAAVWLPGRDKATKTANMKYAYQIRNSAPSVVATSKLNAAGSYQTSYDLYDGMLRARQTQSMSASGGRLLTDTFYDSAGRTAREYSAYHNADPPGSTLSTATDAEDVLTQSRTVYDGAGRVIASIFQPKTVERWRTSTAYAGDRTDVTPPAGGTATSTITDVQGRTVAARQYHHTPDPGAFGTTPASGYDQTTYTFNRKGLLATVTDPAGNRWDYTYDLRGRQITTSDPDKGDTSSTYNAANQITSTTDARGVKLAYGYDALGRRTMIGQTGVGTRARWTYDTVAKGQLARSDRFVGTADYIYQVTAYDDAYRPVTAMVTIPAAETGLAGTYATSTYYKLDGSVSSTDYPQAADLPGELVSYHYDETTNLPIRATTNYGGTPQSYVSGTAYDALGRVEVQELYTGFYSQLGMKAFRSYTYEPDTGRLVGIQTERASQSPNTLVDARYEFNPAGDITKITDAAAGDTQCFEYDYLRRLTQAWTPTSAQCSAAPSADALGGPAPYWLSWTFDKVGNRRTQVQHATATGGQQTSTDYTYPATGADRPHALTGTTTTTGSAAVTSGYTYDAAGNTLTRPTTGAGTQTLTWDPEGHLATSADQTGTTTYIYDPDGNRLVRRDPTGSTLYLPGQEIRYTKATATTTCTRYYGFAGSGIASRTAAGLTWLAGDHQGTATVAINESDQQASIRRQTPYGTPRGTIPPSWPNDKGFVGGTVDNTGLTHLGAREYDPTAGRFISVDPVQDLADPQQWNGYAYGHNSPVVAADPSGLKECGNMSCSQYVITTPSGGERIVDHRSSSERAQDAGYKGTENRIATREWAPPDEPVLNPLAWAEAYYGTHYTNNIFPLHTIMQEWYCYYNRDVCNKSAEEMWDGFKNFLGELTGVNDARRCYNHDWVSCGWLAVSAIPFGRGGKLLKYGDDVADLVRHGDDAADLGRHADDLPCPVRGLSSFSGDTPVLMADGSHKPLSKIKPGDKVIATDPETGEQGPRTVAHVLVHDDQLVGLTLDNGHTITTTEDHPFWNDTDRQWQPANTISLGDQLHAPHGQRLHAAGLLPGPVLSTRAYNLTIDDLHTYYVVAGNTPVLVHNTGPCGTGLKNSSDGLKGIFGDGGVRGKSIIDIRSQLLDNGFSQGLTKNKKGYLFQNGTGEEVRIMRRGGGWDIRVRNGNGNYLDEFGNVANPADTHGIEVYSR